MPDESFPRPDRDTKPVLFGTPPESTLSTCGCALAAGLAFFGGLFLLLLLLTWLLPDF